ncbi:MAG: hypothetical protein NVS9B14_00330 [Candidatus Acidiferrum sp.]
MNTAKRKRIAKLGLAGGVAILGFVAGWLANSRLIFSNQAIVEASIVTPHGDASATTRARVMDAMNVFQAGYDHRNLSELDGFMERLFPRQGEVLLLGTESNEWVRGYDDVKKLIRHDWVDWDHLHLDLTDCQISASGDVAWLATRGYVHSTDSKRPVRFSATLVRIGNEWKFRQLQFQYEDRHAALRDLIQLGSYSQLRWN